MIVSFDMYKPAIFKPYFEECGIMHANPFRSLNRWRSFTWAARHFRAAHHIPLGLVYVNPSCAPDDDKIIVFDTHCTPRYLNWLCEKQPDKRIIFWYWNPVRSRDKEGLLDKLYKRIEVWTYSEKDAKQYGLRLNTQFYFDSLASEAAEAAALPSPQPPKALFYGREKGREAALMELKEQMKEAGIQADYRFIRPNPGPHASSHHEQMVSYRAIVDAVKESQYIVDYYADPTAGLSLRAMEALFFGKKLITNRPLMRDEDFYDSRNIYILGDETRSLKEFSGEPYTAPPPEIRDRYLISNWLKRFDE